MIQLFKQGVFAILFASVTVSSFALDQSERETLKINDLRYGQALYHFYQEKYFSSITDLMVAKQRKPITTQNTDPELLLGGLYLYYGLHQNASSIFSELIENNTSHDVQDRAWFNIGKMSYQSQLYEDSQQALKNVKNTLSAEKNAERHNMLANIYLNKKDFTNAYDSLKQLKTHQDWEVYAKYNMGIALIKSGEPDKGTLLLHEISILKTDNVELKALKDKANIALGYAHIRQKQPGISTIYLKRVRLKGPLSAKALLGIGWAYQQQYKFEQALVAWMELRNWPVIDTAVQESLLAIPYTLEEMGKSKLALNHYTYASENYKKELDNLENVINAIKGGELLLALRPAMITENTLDPEYKNILPESISVPYLYHLLNSIDFQHTHKNYLELIYLQKNLRKWKNQFPAYNLMLQERRHYYKKQLHATKGDSRLNLVNTLKKKRDQLAKKVTQIKQQHDVFALATDDEKEMSNSLNKIRQSLNRLEKKDDFSDEKEKYNLLHGILLWDISTDYAPRYWKVKNELNQVNKALEVTTKRLKSIQQSSKNAPLTFTGFNKIIKNKEKKLNKLLNNISRMIIAQEKLIENKALISLQQRYHQIENYHIRARYSLARLYDKLTLPAKVYNKTNIKTDENK